MHLYCCDPFGNRIELMQRVGPPPATASDLPEERRQPSITLRQVSPDEREAIIPILLAADEGEERVRTMLADAAPTSYTAWGEERLVGAATVRWETAESEIIYIAVVDGMRGHGYGTAIIAALQAEARERHVSDLLVGTANSSLANIGFYQKCGFRMDHVRHDFFDYIQPPITEGGIPVRDMVVLRYQPRG